MRLFGWLYDGGVGAGERIRRRLDPRGAVLADALHRWLLDQSLSELAWIEQHRPRVMVCSAAGDRFSVRLVGYWDMDPWQSDLVVQGSVQRVRFGRRARCRHSVIVQRWAEDLPLRAPDLRDPRLDVWFTTL